MKDVLELGPSGWVRNEIPWEPDASFFGVLGNPIEHSLSPAMHNAALAERELESEYLPIRLDADQVGRLKELPASAFLAGFNVTSPLKEVVAAICDDLTDQARVLEAVNAVKVEKNGSWRGHNTDSGGILSVLTEAWTETVPPVKATVLGTGGSARAAVDALTRWGVSTVTVQAHSAGGFERFEEWVRKQENFQNVLVETLPAEPPEVPSEPAVWVCCLQGGVVSRPFLPDAGGDVSCLLLDLRYGSQLPSSTVPLGFQFADGLPVLLMQGVLSFAWWFGPPIPMLSMRAALG
ncbi:MAG: hypothetical protein KOO60_06580 [Gemmatimonadales bacterium]|nr:hypothetical protein [Gemmatimonadales bacterium]